MINKIGDMFLYISYRRAYFIIQEDQLLFSTLAMYLNDSGADSDLIVAQLSAFDLAAISLVIALL